MKYITELTCKAQESFLGKSIETMPESASHPLFLLVLVLSISQDLTGVKVITCM